MTPSGESGEAALRTDPCQAAFGVVSHRRRQVTPPPFSRPRPDRDDPADVAGRAGRERFDAAVRSRIIP